MTPRPLPRLISRERLDSLYSFHMMSRRQRIEFEILDCALNRVPEGHHSEGYSTAVIVFLKRLRLLFPDVETREFKEACKGLALQNAIQISFPSTGGYRTYRGGVNDDVEFFDAKVVRLKSASGSHGYFRELGALIEVPGLKPDPAKAKQ